MPAGRRSRRPPRGDGRRRWPIPGGPRAIGGHGRRGPWPAPGPRWSGRCRCTPAGPPPRCGPGPAPPPAPPRTPRGHPPRAGTAPAGGSASRTTGASRRQRSRLSPCGGGTAGALARPPDRPGTRPRGIGREPALGREPGQADAAPDLLGRRRHGRTDQHGHDAQRLQRVCRAPRRRPGPARASTARSPPARRWPRRSAATWPPAPRGGRSAPTPRPPPPPSTTATAASGLTGSGAGPMPPHLDPTTVATRDIRLPRLLARSAL